MHTLSTANFTSPETASFWRFISSSLDRLMHVLDGRTIEELNWRPPAPETNSLYVLGIHTLANAQENILGTLCNQPVIRNHADEFASVADDASIPIPFWPSLRVDLQTALSRVDAQALDATYLHPRRGPIVGRDILIIVARHAAEHLGQAELTRDLAVAAFASVHDKYVRGG